MKSEKDLSLVFDPAAEIAASGYWEVGAHPNYLLSVNEDVVTARERLAQVADTTLTVILYGERGVGKEVLAHGVHNLSSREPHPFTALNAYAVPKAALERELFGHGSGGKLAAAEQGTLYIHGIELLPAEVNARLVEWKKEQEGSGHPDPRIILSCEAPSMSREGLEDLQRMWVRAGGAVRVEIPALRERPEDIPLLATHIVQKYGPFYGSNIRVLRGSFLRFLQGIGVGGEWGGAVLLALEHSGGARRGLHGAWPQMGVPAGLLLSTSVFAALSAWLPEPAFLAWGWRVPFLISVVLIGVGLFVRLQILETPVFEKLKADRRESSVPLLDVLREHPRELLIFQRGPSPKFRAVAIPAVEGAGRHGEQGAEQAAMHQRGEGSAKGQGGAAARTRAENRAPEQEARPEKGSVLQHMKPLALDSGVIQSRRMPGPQGEPVQDGSRQRA